MNPFRVPGVARGAAAALLSVALAACATPVAPTHTLSPSAAAADPSGWVAARVEQPASIEAAPPSAPVFCSPCHPDVGSYITSVVDVRGSYLAFGYLFPPAAAVAWSSNDGSQWKRVASFPGGEGSQILAAVGDAGGIVAVGAAGPDAAGWRTLTDKSWAVTPLPAADPHPGTIERATAVARVATGYVAAGYTETAGQRHAVFWRSMDGSTWTRVAAPAGSGQDQVTGIAAGSGSVVAVGIAGDDRTGSAAVWRSSDDGVTWSRISADSLSQGRMLALAVAGSGYVAVGEATDSSGARAWTSFDGREWDLAPDQPALQNGGREQVMTAVADTGKAIVAVGWKSDAANASADVWQSKDGRTWSAMEAPPSFYGGGMAALNVDDALVAAGTVGWPDTHAAQVWVLSKP